MNVNLYSVSDFQRPDVWTPRRRPLKEAQKRFEGAKARFEKRKEEGAPRRFISLAETYFLRAERELKLAKRVAQKKAERKARAAEDAAAQAKEMAEAKARGWFSPSFKTEGGAWGFENGMAAAYEMKKEKPELKTDDYLENYKRGYKRGLAAKN